ncbi:MAG: hypothetical protein JKY70_05020 [Mucilaginibacter sp.]|nr:hypothetical protein [Mucilaginibacter sp.]
MKLSTLNVIAFRTACISMSLLLIVKAIGMLNSHYPIKAGVGFAATLLTLATGFRKPSFGNWLTMFNILSFALLLFAIID